MKLIFRKWLVQYRWIIIGTLFGAVAGFLYWNYVGCLTDTCAITSDPTQSTAYFAVMGGLLFSFLKNPREKKLTDSSDQRNQSGD